MRRISTSFIAVLLMVSCPVLFGQSTQIAGVSSSYPIKDATVGGVAFSFNLSVTYPVGLAASSYISGTQLNSDFQGFLAAYPNPSDPPEAILSNVLQSLLSKYSQMAGGSLIGEIAGPGQSIGGIMIPGLPAGSVSVFIGNYSPLSGLLGLLEKNGKPRNAQPVAPLKQAPAR
jgi:hypothetical protein